MGEGRLAFEKRYSPTLRAICSRCLSGRLTLSSTVRVCGRAYPRQAPLPIDHQSCRALPRTPPGATPSTITSFAELSPYDAQNITLHPGQHPPARTTLQPAWLPPSHALRHWPREAAHAPLGTASMRRSAG
jgi:hypothetical protein